MSPDPLLGAGAAGHPLFDVKGLTLRFGGVTSLNDVSFRMSRGEILACIGPNGAGKTSLFNSLTGVYRPQEGSVAFRATESSDPVQLVARQTDAITRLGIARTFQNIRLFPVMTALENVQVAVEAQHRSGPLAAMLGLPRQRREERAGEERAAALLRRVGLQAKENALARSLSYGEQRRLEIARALGSQPSVLLLDEPAAGTNSSEKNDLSELIVDINERDGVALLLIEHDMRLVMSVAHRVLVLNFGGVIADGEPQAVQRNPDVVAAYLGQDRSQVDYARLKEESR